MILAFIVLYRCAGIDPSSSSDDEDVTHLSDTKRLNISKGMTYRRSDQSRLTEFNKKDTFGEFPEVDFFDKKRCTFDEDSIKITKRKRSRRQNSKVSPTIAMKLEDNGNNNLKSQELQLDYSSEATTFDNQMHFLSISDLGNVQEKDISMINPSNPTTSASDNSYQFQTLFSDDQRKTFSDINSHDHDDESAQTHRNLHKLLQTNQAESISASFGNSVFQPSSRSEEMSLTGNKQDLNLSVLDHLHVEQSIKPNQPLDIRRNIDNVKDELQELYLIMFWDINVQISEIDKRIKRITSRKVKNKVKEMENRLTEFMKTFLEIRGLFDSIIAEMVVYFNVKASIYFSTFTFYDSDVILTKRYYENLSTKCKIVFKEILRGMINLGEGNTLICRLNSTLEKAYRKIVEFDSFFVFKK